MSNVEPDNRADRYSTAPILRANYNDDCTVLLFTSHCWPFQTAYRNSEYSVPKPTLRDSKLELGAHNLVVPFQKQTLVVLVVFKSERCEIQSHWQVNLTICWQSKITVCSQQLSVTVSFESSVVWILWWTSVQFDKMQIVCAENGDISLDKAIKSNCAMCTNESPTVGASPLEVPSKLNGQPYYLCTVTCCDSINCTKPSTTSLISKAIVTKADSGHYPQFSTQTTARPNGLITTIDQSKCPMCVRQTRPRLVLVTNPTNEYMTPTRNGDCSSPNKSADESCSPKLSATKSEQCNSPISKGHRQDSTRRSPKPQYLANEKSGKMYSPELSSSPPILANSSLTDYTDSYTPVCTSANSNHVENESPFKFSVGRKASPLNSEYSFYFSKVENHGFFRKAVPTLPIAVAVLFCLLNLVIPGSGTNPCIDCVNFTTRSS